MLKLIWKTTLLAFVVCTPLSLLINNLSFYWQKKRHIEIRYVIDSLKETKRIGKFQNFVVGDSSLQYAYNPTTSSIAMNLSMATAGPQEIYFSILKLLAANKKVKCVVTGFSFLGNDTYEDKFWHNFVSLDYYRWEEFLSLGMSISSHFKFLLYQIKFPVLYSNYLRASLSLLLKGKLSDYKNYTKNIYKYLKKTNGFFHSTGQINLNFLDHFKKEKFSLPSKNFKKYLKKINGLVIDKNIKVIYVEHAPSPKLIEENEVVSNNFIKVRNEIKESFSNHPSFYYYDDIMPKNNRDMFGDLMHLNEAGRKYFTRELNYRLRNICY